MESTLSEGEVAQLRASASKACALLKALEDGRIQQQRMNSYRSIIASLTQDTY